jgi:hypothetical protein
LGDDSDIKAQCSQTIGFPEKKAKQFFHDFGVCLVCCGNGLPWLDLVSMFPSWLIPFMTEFKAHKHQPVTRIVEFHSFGHSGIPFVSKHRGKFHVSHASVPDKAAQPRGKTLKPVPLCEKTAGWS